MRGGFSKKAPFALQSFYALREPTAENNRLLNRIGTKDLADPVRRNDNSPSLSRASEPLTMFRLPPSMTLSVSAFGWLVTFLVVGHSDQWWTRSIISRDFGCVIQPAREKHWLYSTRYYLRS